MRMSRNKRAAIGAACMVAAALVMGWFAGRYIPGQPMEPQQAPMSGLTEGSGIMATETVELPRGSTLQLRSIVQGFAFKPGTAKFPREVKEAYEQRGEWEYACPDVELSVVETAVASTASFAEWNPLYRSGVGEWTYNDSMLVTVTLSITNASKERVTVLRKLPELTLWSDNLAYVDDVMGAGALVDSAFTFINDLLPEYVANPNVDGDGRYIDLEPGESQTIMLPFKVNKNNLKDQTAFDDLNPSDFCIQTSDFATATTYRLWL